MSSSVNDQDNALDMLQSGALTKICAPMVRYSKLPFRLLVQKYGCDVVYTPMIIADSFIRSLKARDSEFTTCEADRPLIVQFAAKNAREFADASELVIPYACGSGLNCGCPQRWAMQEGYGSCLLTTPELVADMVKQTQACTPENFSVDIKIRLSSDIKHTVELVRRAEKTGVSWISVHGRTPAQRTQPVDLDAIKLLKETVDCPVVANGDINSLQDAENVQKLTNVNGVMSARGILSNPAMFAGYDYTPKQCVKDFVSLSLRHGSQFTTFHHHIMFMIESILSKPQRCFYNSLTSTPAVLDFLRADLGLDACSESVDDISKRTSSLELCNPEQ